MSGWLEIALAVNFAPMTDGVNRHYAALIVNGIKHTVVANTQAITVFTM